MAQIEGVGSPSSSPNPIPLRPLDRPLIPSAIPVTVGGKVIQSGVWVCACVSVTPCLSVRLKEEIKMSQHGRVIAKVYQRNHVF